MHMLMQYIGQEMQILINFFSPLAGMIYGVHSLILNKNGNNDKEA